MGVYAVSAYDTDIPSHFCCRAGRQAWDYSPQPVPHLTPQFPAPTFPYLYLYVHRLLRLLWTAPYLHTVLPPFTTPSRGVPVARRSPPAIPRYHHIGLSYTLRPGYISISACLVHHYTLPPEQFRSHTRCAALRCLPAARHCVTACHFVPLTPPVHLPATATCDTCYHTFDARLFPCARALYGCCFFTPLRAHPTTDSVLPFHTACLLALPFLCAAVHCLRAVTFARNKFRSTATRLPVRGCLQHRALRAVVISQLRRNLASNNAIAPRLSPRVRHSGRSFCRACMTAINDTTIFTAYFCRVANAYRCISRTPASTHYYITCRMTRCTARRTASPDSWHNVLP